MTLTRLVSALTAAVLVAAGCGGSDGVGSRELVGVSCGRDPYVTVLLPLDDVLGLGPEACEGLGDLVSISLAYPCPKGPRTITVVPIDDQITQRGVSEACELTADQGGMASDDPAIWMAEISDLRASAGPGRLVGFVALDETASSGAPSSPTQPVCVGASEFITITPGAEVSALSATGDRVAVSTLRGSAYDGHTGCGMWFGLDLPSSTDQIQLDIAGHQLSDVVDPEDLDANGWILQIWSTPETLAAYCIEAESMACALLQP